MAGIGFELYKILHRGTLYHCIRVRVFTIFVRWYTLYIFPIHR